MANPNLECLDETVFDFLLSLREKPALYIGEKSLTRLNIYLAGYEHGLGRLGKALKQRDEFHAFHDWVAAKLDFTSSTSGWRGMILSRSASESAAFDLFFQLLEEFQRERGLKS